MNAFSQPFRPVLAVTLALLSSGNLAGIAMANDTSNLREVHSQPSWVIQSDQIELAVTKLGAHMAPVKFFRKDAQPIEPYHISPWQGENLDLAHCPVLVPLRGDFFCLPFGGNQTPYQGENHPPHGETAGSPWTFGGVEKKGGLTSLTLTLEPKIRAGKIQQQIALVDGQNVLYTKTVIHGFKGKTTLAHHAILAMPEKEKAIQISTSPILFGMTCPYPFSNPAAKEYQSLAVGAKFTDLSQVPVLFKNQPPTDCSVFPNRRGFADLLQVFEKPGKQNTPAWITAVNSENHSIWFALKDPKLMPGRVFWMENQGRHGQPWNGRNNCLGLEDGCTFFDKGLAESIAPNVINKQGVPTCLELTGEKPFVVPYIQGVVKVSPNFKKVASVSFSPGKVEFVSSTGERVSANVRHEFLFGAALEE